MWFKNLIFVSQSLRRKVEEEKEEEEDEVTDIWVEAGVENRGVSLFRGHWAPHLCRTLLLVHFVSIYICIVCSGSGRLYLPPNLIILPHGSLNGRAKKLLIVNPESKITKSQSSAFQNPHKITVYFSKITKSQSAVQNPHSWISSQVPRPTLRT